jgi:pyridoxamine 5'-phosphate oxidase
MSLSDLRREYALAALDLPDLHADPVVQFQRWFADAQRADVAEPNAMTLSTAGADGAPSGRIVLLKDVDHRGFTFFTDYRSRKARELDANPRAALTFLWKEIERQVRIAGTVERVTAPESDRYYISRPLGSRHGAWASVQSQPIPDRDWLERAVQDAASRYPDDPPRPDHWGGYRVHPVELEFWQGRPSRLHDRFRYTRRDATWAIERLSP